MGAPLRRDPYALLEVPRNASTLQIRAAYRVRARALHPDRNPDDPVAEERFKGVTWAYEVLGDPSRRAIYDEFGEAGLVEGFDAGAMRQYRDWRPPGLRTEGWSGNLADVFGRSAAGPGRPAFGEEDVEAFFRAAVRRPAAAPAVGRDVQQDLHLSLPEALRGGEHLVAVSASAGRVVRVRLPPGVREGERLRVRGQGAPGQGGAAAGDLVLTVRVAPHAWLRREGDDLHAVVPLSLPEAVRGARVQLPGVHGAVEVAVPPGTRSGDRVAVPRAGARRRDGSVGDLVVEFDVRPPPKAPEADALLQALDMLYPQPLRAHLEL